MSYLEIADLSSEKKNKKLKFITYFLLLCPRIIISHYCSKVSDNPYREYFNQNQNWRKPLKSSIN